MRLEDERTGRILRGLGELLAREPGTLQVRDECVAVVLKAAAAAWDEGDRGPLVEAVVELAAELVTRGMSGLIPMSGADR